MAQHNRDDGSLEKYFDTIRELPLLTPEEERIYGRRWQEERDPEALRMLVEGNLRFVVKEARKFRNMGLDLLDLISEGNLGLIEAAKRFDPNRENKFLTYASWWVRQAIFHALADQGSKIRLPQKVAGHLVQLRRVRDRLSQQLGREPSLQEIVEASPQFTAEDVERLLRLERTTTVLSTEQETGDSEMTLEGSLEQSVELSPLEALDQEAFQEQLRESLAMLSEKERTIITLHFGLDDQEPMTLERIGKMFTPPISRERVRQIEERAFRKIRERRRAELGDYVRKERL